MAVGKRAQKQNTPSKPESRGSLGVLYWLPYWPSPQNAILFADIPVGKEKQSRFPNRISLKKRKENRLVRGREMLKLREGKGLTYREIGQKYNLSGTMVFRLIKEYKEHIGFHQK